MKIFNTIPFCLALVLIGTRLQAATTDSSQTGTVNVPPPTTPQITSTGANFNLWQWQSYEALPNGQVVAHNHSYTELAGGLNYLGTNGLWIPAQELIQPYVQGALAQYGQAQVIYANNLNTASGVIDEQTPDGKRLTSTVVGLLYVDPTTGQSVQIAEAQDSEGQLIAANQVLYTNAFSGNGIKASVRYVYRRDGTEQEVILDAQPPAPEAFGLSSKTAELVVVSEFISPPPATVFNLATNADGESDQAVSWGATSLGRGKAFSLGGQDVPAAVIKQYVNVNGHYYLFEKVKYRDIQQALSALPLQSSTAQGVKGMALRKFKFPNFPRTAQRAHPLKSKLESKLQLVPHPMKVAYGKGPAQGYVLDYITLNSTYSDYIFYGDTTYFISGNVNLSGANNVIQPCCIIKYAAGTSITIASGGAITLGSAPWRPCLFTAKDDNVLGETISGSTGAPSGYYADPALNIGSMGNVTLNDFRILYANRAVSVGSASPTIYDAQFVNCATAISDLNYGYPTLGNVLFSSVKTNFNATAGSWNTVSVQNATFNNGFDLVDGDFSNTPFYLTNCAFVNQTNLSGTLTAGYNGFYRSPTVGSPTVSSSTYPLQPVGAANCYLTNSSAFLNAGTSNINSWVLSLLNVKTVYPPVIYSSTTITTATTLTPQAGRDNLGNPCLGYHYEPLDYAFGNTVAKSNLTFTAGTAVGWFYTSGGGTYALDMGDSATAAFSGTVTAPCHFTRYSMVQEGNGNWTPQSWLGAITGQSYTHAPPGLTATFTIFSTPATEAGPFRDNGSTLFVFTGNDCECYTGGGGGYFASINSTNNLYYNGSPIIYKNYGSANLTLENCTCYRGTVEGDNTSGGYWPVTLVNCAFDSTSFYLNSHGNPTNGYYTDYNSFLVGSNTTPYLGGHEVYVSGSYNWQTNWFGNFYQSTNSPLIQKGSTTANLVGLYHFTALTNQVPETNSIVTIGYHYVATDAYGNPLDTNGDGIPDYLEDPNGNGLVDSGEVGWNIGGDLGLKVVIARPRANTVLP